MAWIGINVAVVLIFAGVETYLLASKQRRQALICCCTFFPPWLFGLLGHH